MTALSCLLCVFPALGMAKALDLSAPLLLNHA